MSRADTPSLPLYHASAGPSKSSRAASPLLQPPVASGPQSSSPPSSITSAYSLLSSDETAQKLHTSVSHGLSASDASARIHIHGPNELPHEDPEPLWLRFVKQFKETLILLLLGSAGVSVLIGNLDDAVSITIAVTIVVSVGFVQEYRSEKSLEALNQLVPHSAHIIRAGTENSQNGKRVPNGVAAEGIELENLKDTPAALEAAERKSTTISATLLVPGDLVLFHTGDRIPADIRITHAADLTIDESNLTGENEPVPKSPDTITPPPGSQRPSSPFYASEAAGTVGTDIRLNDQKNIAFMGTLVRSGYGQGIVIGTGGKTEFGAISASLQEIESPRTPLQLSMDQLGKDLSYMSFVVIAFIGLVGLWRGWKLLEVFQIGVSLAVAAIPEGLPIIVTVTLALGVLRMSKRDAIVRRLPSVETLATVNVVCTDKTGTLTTNHMTVTKLWHFDEPAPIEVKKELDSTDLDSPTRNILRIGNIVNNARLLSDQAASASTAAVLSSTLGDDNSMAKSRWVGQPTDVALLDLLDEFGEDDVRERLGERKFETPFSSERKWMGVVINGSSGVGLTPGPDVAYIKGALERVLDRCDTYVTSQGREVVLDQARKDVALKAAESMAQEGLRVLGFASGTSKSRAKSTSGTSSPALPKSGLGEDEQYRGLVFAGLVGMNDPPRKGVEKAIRRLMAGKVKVIMITGDAETTAVAIGKSLGMPIIANSALGRSVIRGDELDQMSEEELAQAIATTSIFARTSPDHKMKIIRALQSRGDVVAMTGDGVNDAPALKKADIGISMGKLGTDVAKEAADMILTDDNFATILNAIEEGKGIFYNIQNFLTFQLSTSAAALSLVLFSTFLGFRNPLNAMQILWINILMDGPPAQSLGVEPVDPAVMALPPRSRHARVLTRPLIQRVLQSATIIMLGTLMTYYREMSDDNEVTARDTTMTFTCFVLFDMFNALTCRSNTKSILNGDIGVFDNKMFNYAVAGSLLGQLMVIYFPPLQRVFQTEALSLLDLAHLCAVASCVFWADEGRKWLLRWKRGHGLGRGYSTVV